MDQPKRRKAAAVTAVAFNLVPVAGVLFGGWSAFALIFLYWLENLAVGARTALGMVGGAALNRSNVAASSALAGFFTVHYGVFCLVHGVFVVSLFGGAAMSGGGMFDLAGAARTLFDQQPGLTVGLISILLWQAVQLVLFLFDRPARSASPLEQMAAPYPRIVVLHLTIIFSGFLVLLLNEPIAGLVLLALIKMGFDVAEALGKTPRLTLKRRQAAPDRPVKPV